MCIAPRRAWQCLCLSIVLVCRSVLKIKDRLSGKGLTLQLLPLLLVELLQLPLPLPLLLPLSLSLLLLPLLLRIQQLFQQLTEKGMQQALKLGEYVRKTYVESVNFMPPSLGSGGTNGTYSAWFMSDNGESVRSIRVRK